MIAGEGENGPEFESTILAVPLPDKNTPPSEIVAHISALLQASVHQIAAMISSAHRIESDIYSGTLGFASKAEI